MKTNIDKFYKNNTSLETEGVWFDISDDVGFLLARFGGANSHKIKMAMAKFYKPYSRQIENGSLDPKKDVEITTRVFVEVCILDWKGIEIDEVVTAFDKEIAFKFFLELPELVDQLMKHAQDSKNYREDLGNF